MRLRALLQASGLPPGLADPEISSLCHDSRAAVPGCLFFALPGAKSDGFSFVEQAAALGAAATVVEKALENPGCPLVVVDNARAAMADVAAAFHGHPDRPLKCVGVTGTNGKTTTAFLLKHLFDSVGMRCGLVGTVKYVVGDTELPAARTTPESLDLQHLLADMRDLGDRAVAMEVSSHSLVQDRVRGIEFDAAVFTNLTQDHLDYHGSMDAYFEAKARLFESLAHQTAKKPRAIVNSDDRFGQRLLDRFSKRLKTVSFGQNVHADFRASAIRQDLHGTRFALEARGKSYLVRSPLIGLFNVYNTLGALAAAMTCGVELRRAIDALAAAPQVPGRLERVPARRNFQVFVDYAHTDDALRNVLQTLRECGPARLIAVFGCGGDRDRAKRPLMAAAGESLADLVILTSDNPRSEDPAAILAEMEKGLTRRTHETIPDREAAIRRAIDLAGPGDIVLIAGKGHEKTQEFADQKIPFDDVAVAARAISDKKGGEA
jgi:UDP-N-acetylmuramoyl-L-alanyl-D-glutamate--2,6-diaminopimelate ligase